MITLKPLQQEDREQFIKDNQKAFNYGAWCEVEKLHPEVKTWMSSSQMECSGLRRRCISRIDFRFCITIYNLSIKK